MIDMWHVTHDMRELPPDMWHVIHDMWKLPPDMWHITHGVGLTFSQNVTFLALTAWDLWCFEYLEEKDDSLTHWINYLMTKVFVK